MYLETTIRSAIQFLDELCAVLGETIEKPTTKEQKLEHWQKAGETKFEFIKIGITNASRGTVNARRCQSH
ncbi:hypothetical protein [Vibrio cholerae]|uniref:hypothetical protein n=1 Tax=Vibrio cholerae TaxID=666 RepID=UPI0006BB7FB8|nr:hypothetical protein [Vibrio cholerae]